MRIGGVNTGSVHTSQSHHVTECVHDHQHSKDSAGGMDALSFSAEKSETMHFSQNGKGQEGQGMLSLSEGLRSLVARGRKLAGRLWNGPVTDRMGVVNPQQVSMEGRTGADRLWQRFKLKVYTATGHLAKRFGRGTSLQTGIKGEQGKSREEFRRQGQRKKRQDEIESVPADRSYLMDSYDKNGKYVRLGGNDSVREYHKRDGK